MEATLSHKLLALLVQYLFQVFVKVVIKNHLKLINHQVHCVALQLELHFELIWSSLFLSLCFFFWSSTFIHNQWLKRRLSRPLHMDPNPDSFWTNAEEVTHFKCKKLNSVKQRGNTHLQMKTGFYNSCTRLMSEE